MLVFGSVIASFLLLSFVFIKELTAIWRHIALVAVFLSIGVLSHQLHLKTNPKSLELRNSTVIFQLDKKLNSNEKNKRYEIEVLDVGKPEVATHLPFRAVFSLPKDYADLDFAHLYKAEVYLNNVEPPANDYQFNYAKYLSRKNIFYQVYAPNGLQIGEKPEPSFYDKIRQSRLNILHKIDSLSLSVRSREFLKGIMLADRTEMDAQTVQDFNRSGLVHLLAISGSHMAIIFWLILYLLKPVFTGNKRFIPVLVSLVFIWLFAVLIDFGSSVVRSCIMLTVYYAAVLLQRKPDLLHAMALSALLILLYDTHQLFDVGFQLSYLAVFGIFWLNRPIRNRLPRIRGRAKFLTSIISITLAAQIATLPLVLYYFHQFSVMSVLANLVIIPMAEIILVSSLFLTIFTAVGIQLEFLIKVYDLFISFVLKIVHFFAEVEMGFSDTIPISLAEVIVLLLVIYFLRFAIISPSNKNLIRLTAVLILFFGLRLSLNQIYRQKDEIVVHYIFKESFVSVKRDEKIWFYLPENVNRKRAEKFALKPYLVSRRASKYNLSILPKGVKCLTINNQSYCFD